MEIFTTLKDTPVPTLLVIGGFIFLFLGIATIKKPIVIEVTPSGRKMALTAGIVLIGTGIYFLSIQIPEQTSDPLETATPTAMVTEETPSATATLSQITLTPSITPLSVSSTSGFENDCINANTWTPYIVNVKFPKIENCWDMTTRGISAHDNKLLFSVNNSSEQSGSIYMSLPKYGTVNFSVQVDQFKINDSYGDLVFGLGNKGSWFQEGKFMLLRVTQPDSPIYLVYGTAVTKSGDKFFDSYEMGSQLNITFEVNDSVLNIFANDAKVMENISLSPLDKQVFWIGYRLPKNAQLIAFVSNFSVAEK